MYRTAYSLFMVQRNIPSGRKPSRGDRHGTAIRRMQRAVGAVEQGGSSSGRRHRYASRRSGRSAFACSSGANARARSVNLAIDSKLRSFDLAQLRVRDSRTASISLPAIVMQRKTQRPVQFEVTEQTRVNPLQRGSALPAGVSRTKPPACLSASVDTAVRMDRPRAGEGDWPQPGRVWNPYPASHESLADLSPHEEPARRSRAPFDTSALRWMTYSRWPNRRKCKDDHRSAAGACSVADRPQAEVQLIEITSTKLPFSSCADASQKTLLDSHRASRNRYRNQAPGPPLTSVVMVISQVNCFR